jgi:hypothetical protein
MEASDYRFAPHDKYLNAILYSVISSVEHTSNVRARPSDENEQTSDVMSMGLSRPTGAVSLRLRAKRHPWGMPLVHLVCIVESF